MTQEQKDLLLKDLCARLPYGVWIERKLKSCKFGARCRVCAHDIGAIKRGRYDFYKPYLYPLSSMTEDQKKEYRKVGELDTEILVKHPMDGSPFPALYNSQDWLDAHHFDYRGLIPMGLANDATDKNIY